MASLRCIIARLDVRNGVMRTNPVLIDTTRALTKANGTITLNDERMALALTGAPKTRSILRLDGSVPILGTIKQPSIVVPKETKSVGNVVKMVGRAIAGKQGPTASDTDCRAMAANVLR